MIEEVKILNAGYCTGMEKMVLRGGSKKILNFPAKFALIKTVENGLVLYDTGYTDRFFSGTNRFPLSLYRKITPVSISKEESAINKLKKIGIKPKDIEYIIISHFHPDHIGGLKDFPNAKFICRKSAFEAVKGRKGFSALRLGFIANHIPEDFESRVKFLEDKNSIDISDRLYPFIKGIDIFGNNSLIAIDLSGHSRGHTGLYLKTLKNKEYFFVSDACWLNKSYQEIILPSKMSNLIIDNPKSNYKTLKKINAVHKNYKRISIIPSHSPKFV
ncbi:MBL fold metallo-hydrolase [Halonatronum saccharophilum]|uniref:MBL fold metallo-hydrolase n=1 Tax=Halonatronum saccharophilum TaxID=150060 RepID=UPI000483EE8A|nr:MBL fold metallo-hydrolase [Halonatronum saccharophilum]